MLVKYWVTHGNIRPYACCLSSSMAFFQTSKIGMPLLILNGAFWGSSNCKGLCYSFKPDIFACVGKTFAGVGNVIDHRRRKYFFACQRSLPSRKSRLSFAAWKKSAHFVQQQQQQLSVFSSLSRKSMQRKLAMINGLVPHGKLWPFQMQPLKYRQTKAFFLFLHFGLHEYVIKVLSTSDCC